MKKEYLAHVAVMTNDEDFDVLKLDLIMADLGYVNNPNAGDGGVWTDGRINTKTKEVKTLIHYEGYKSTASTKRAHQDIVDAIRKAHGLHALFETPTVETEWTETEPQHSYST
jgi:hypothetical protein